MFASAGISHELRNSGPVTDTALLEALISPAVDAAESQMKLTVTAIGAEDEFSGIIDLVEMKAYNYTNDLGTDIEEIEIPGDLQDLAEEWRTKLVEAVAETDEELMMAYLEGEEIDVPTLKAAIRKATVAADFYPVFCGSAFKNKGVQLMLDGVIDYLPSPLDVPAIKGIDPDTDAEVERHASDEEPFSALAFKVLTDPFVGAVDRKSVV